MKKKINTDKCKSEEEYRKMLELYTLLPPPPFKKRDKEKCHDQTKKKIATNS